VPPCSIKDHSRCHLNVEARHLAIAILRQQKIGTDRHIGKLVARTRSNVVKTAAKIRDLIETGDRETKRNLNSIFAALVPRLQKGKMI
jgi:hypothetical protein